MQYTQTTSRRGFTLIEISIVLVITALISGGIMAGKALIQQAELQHITKEANNLSTSTATFIVKYNALPGDLKTATVMWGTADGNGQDSACAHARPNTGQNANAGQNSVRTCNGDGDGLIAHSFLNDPNIKMIEYYRFWQHLSNAGLSGFSVSGAPMQGASGATGYEDAIGDNIPRTTRAVAGYSVHSDTNLVYKAMQSPNWIQIAGCCDTVNHMASVPVFTPLEQRALDMKLDDGVAGRGRVQALITTAVSSGCATSTTPETAEYQIGNPDGRCALEYNLEL